MRNAITEATTDESAVAIAEQGAPVAPMKAVSKKGAISVAMWTLPRAGEDIKAINADA